MGMIKKAFSLWLAMYAYSCTPHSGHVVEIVSESLHSKYARTFDHLTDDTCPDAVRVNRTVADMTMYWEIMGGEETNEDTGLPDVLIVQMTMPSDNVWSLPRYLREYVATELPISAVVVGGDSPCEFTVAHLPKCGEEVDGAGGTGDGDINSCGGGGAMLRPERTWWTCSTTPQVARTTDKMIMRSIRRMVGARRSGREFATSDFVCCVVMHLSRPSIMHHGQTHQTPHTWPHAL